MVSWPDAGLIFLRMRVESIRSSVFSTALTSRLLRGIFCSFSAISLFLLGIIGSLKLLGLALGLRSRRIRGVEPLRALAGVMAGRGLLSIDCC